MTEEICILGKTYKRTDLDKKGVTSLSQDGKLFWVDGFETDNLKDFNDLSAASNNYWKDSDDGYAQTLSGQEIYAVCKFLRLQKPHELKHFLKIETLAQGYCYDYLCKNRDKENLESIARKGLITHLEENRNIKHSLSWYLTERQALRFAILMEEGNENHDTELDLINKIFDLDLDFFSGSTCKIVDIGCGGGEKSLEIITKLQGAPGLYPPNIQYYPIDGSPYFVNLTLERLARTNGLYIYDFAQLESIFGKINNSDNKSIKKYVSTLEGLETLIESEDISTLNAGNLSYDYESVMKKGDKHLKKFKELGSKGKYTYKSASYEALEKGMIGSAFFLTKASIVENISGKDSDWRGYLKSKIMRSRKRISLMSESGFVDPSFNLLKNLDVSFRNIQGIINQEKISPENLIDLLSYSEMIDYVVHFSEDSSNRKRIYNPMISMSSFLKGIPKFESLGLVGDMFDTDFIRKAQIITKMRDMEGHVAMNLLLGQTLGNFSENERIELLGNIYELSSPGDYTMIGVELRPSESLPDYELECKKIARKYSGGDQFLNETLNILGCGDFDEMVYVEPLPEKDYWKIVDKEKRYRLLQDVKFRSYYNNKTNSVEMFYRVKKDVVFTDGKTKVEFKAREVIPAASSYKFSPGKLDEEGNYGKTELEELCEAVGFTIVGEPAIHANKQGRPDYMVLMVKK